MSNKSDNKELGKGIEALIRTHSSNKDKNSILFIPLKKIIPNKANPREDFNDKEMKKLKDSILQHGILQALNIMGGNIQIKNKRTINGEIIGDLEIKTSKLKGCELDSNIVNLMIDELPILSIAAAFANSPSLFKGLGELKFKESDRLELIRHNLVQCGIFCKVEGHDLYIDPTRKKNFKNNLIRTNNDHRIAMSFVVMGMKLGVDLKIMNPEFIKTSFPNFIKIVNLVGGNLTE